MKIYLIFLLIIWAQAVHAVRIGFPAPLFTLPDTTGEPISLFDFRGKHVVLEWVNPDCRRVQRHYQKKTMRQLALHYRGREVIWLAINSSHYMMSEDNARWKDINLLHYRFLGDFSGKVGRLYHAEMTPEMYVINPQGILIYRGAVDDDPDGKNPKPFNYVQAALDESLAGQAVSLPQTTPYGCFVKYKY